VTNLVDGVCGLFIISFLVSFFSAFSIVFVDYNYLL